MGAFEDYISNLENVENPDISEVVSELLKLHSSELENREAKILQLNDTLSEKDGVITKMNSEIVDWKAKNYDLTLQIPAFNNAVTADPDGAGEKDPGTIKIDDLFQN